MLERDFLNCPCRFWDWLRKLYGFLGYTLPVWNFLFYYCTCCWFKASKYGLYELAFSFTASVLLHCWRCMGIGIHRVSACIQYTPVGLSAILQ